jgi:predicted nucleotidyltransferase
MRRHKTHVEHIGIVARKLVELETDFVFTGGAIVGLLLTEPAAADVRPTYDVDIIVGIARYPDYAKLQEKLRQLGLHNDIDGPNCRFRLEGLIVDVMPSEGEILGFTNRWYGHAIHSAIDYTLPDGTVIKIISAPTFIGTKLEAFYDRGKGDYLLSHDLEDIIAVIDGRPELIAEVQACAEDLRRYIQDLFAKLLADSDFVDAISSHLAPDAGSQGRRRIVVERMGKIVQ